MIGEEVRRRREGLGLTGAQLAMRAGLAPSAVSQIETGKRMPSSTSVMKLAAALGIEAGDLFPKAQAPLPLEPEAAGLANALANAEPSAKLLPATVLEDIADLWEEQLRRGFYDRQTLGQMRLAGLRLASTHENRVREVVRETLPPHFQAQLEAAEERFADIGARLWEAQQALEEAGRGHPLPPDELAPRREAKRAELLQKLRGSGQAQHA